MTYMHLSTNSATTKDWLKASENIRISAYDPASVTTPYAQSNQALATKTVDQQQPKVAAKKK